MNIYLIKTYFPTYHLHGNIYIIVAKNIVSARKLWNDTLITGSHKDEVVNSIKKISTDEEMIFKIGK